MTKKKETLRNWEELRDELLLDPATKAEYEKLEPEFAIIREIMKYRIEHDITQKELAQLVGTKQSNISRFENGNSNPSLKFLKKIAEGLGKKLVLCLE